ncbi:MAG: ethanolamine utilization protein EutJ [Clostridia bacterium]|jgi:ethanolamine utilization protein EutJ|nr:ethanolamine utilization protein EutJ [Clostridia bacterium]
MEFLQDANRLIKKFEAAIANPVPVKGGTNLFAGVDLGTAYIVLAVVDQDGEPVAGAMRYAEVVKDGLLVDYVGALDIVRELKREIEAKLGTELSTAGTAYPPGTAEADRRSIRYVAEGAGFKVATVVDEPTVAGRVLGIRNGAVVDIGGGTTGIAVIQDGEVIYVADEPTGGTHFTLVIAGAYHISYADAEQLKTDPQKQQSLFPVVKPVMEKVASIIRRHIEQFQVDNLYLTGGASCFSGIEKVVEAYVGIPTWKPDNPFLVTPVGIALSAQRNWEV